MLSARSTTSQGATMYKWSIVLLLVLVSNARAQGLPSGVDLRAAYCIPILQESVRESEAIKREVEGYLQLPDNMWTRQHQAVVEQQLASTSTKLRRLQLYLLPRLPYLEPYGILTAKKSAEADIANLFRVAQSCND